MGESMTFTPGPWRKYRDKNGRVSKLESIQGRVCTFHPSDANVEANATITESAPDMLAALKYNLMVLYDAHPEPEQRRYALALTKGAIAKAEGRTS
jgi:hypothetical protein